MAQFIGLYRGRTVSEAELVAVCSEESIVRRFFEELLGEGKPGLSEPETGNPEEVKRLAVVRDDE